MDKIQPFKYWVQKTLPAVYDDSLSYYQLLAKIVHHLNTIGDSQNVVIDKVKELTNWFDNLDVQNEINAKLDKMAEDGTLDQIINHNILNDINSQLTQIEGQKADISYVDKKVEAVASGSPKGTYQTLNALKSAFPNGDSGIYVVIEDGNWYYWNGTTWMAGGIYQATGLDETLKQVVTESYNSPIANLVTNGDFSNGSIGWSPLGGAMTVTNNTLTLTGDGSTEVPRIAQQTKLPFQNGRKIAVRFRAKVNNNDCIQIEARLAASGMPTRIATLKTSPIADRWYEGTVILESTGGGSGNFYIQIGHAYADGVSSNNKEMQVQYISVVDLTGVFGAGKELSEGQFEKFISSYKNRYLSGVTTTVDGRLKLQEEMVSSLNQLLIDSTYHSFEWELGSVSTSGSYVTTTIRIRTKMVRLDEGTTIQLRDKNNYSYAYHKYSLVDKSWISGTTWLSESTVLDDDAYYIILMKRLDDSDLTDKIEEVSSNLFVYGKKSVLSITPKTTEVSAVTVNPIDAVVKAIAHRGDVVDAPENTEPAFRTAKYKGFSYVECDVRFTSDGYPVLSHYDQVQGNPGVMVSTSTLAELKVLDVGSWKDAKYAGTKMPTFNEFLILCKKLNLYPYVHIKAGTPEQIGELVIIAKRLGILPKCTWICESVAIGNAVISKDEKARIGYLTQVPLTENTVTSANVLKTGENEVFVYTPYNLITGEPVSNIILDGDLGLETYIVNDEETLFNMVELGVTGILTDTLNVSELLRNG